MIKNFLRDETGLNFRNTRQPRFDRTGSRWRVHHLGTSIKVPSRTWLATSRVNERAKRRARRAKPRQSAPPYSRGSEAPRDKSISSRRKRPELLESRSSRRAHHCGYRYFHLALSTNIKGVTNLGREWGESSASCACALALEPSAAFDRREC